MSAISSHAAGIAGTVRQAAANGSRLRIVGSGGWLDAGRPVHRTIPLTLDHAHGIVEYVPGDLTLTARAGTTLAEIERVTAAEGQFLPLDPFGMPSATIGATIATASCGPLSHVFGTPRDVVLGLEAVTGAGEVIRTGGRVVKNVAGFDLTRLLTGSWGTLGVITEVSVRLRALPEADETLAFQVRHDGPDGIAEMLARLRAASIAPWAFELLSPALAATLGVAHRTAAIMRLAGNGASVKAQRAALGALTECSALDREVWGKLRRCEPANAAVIRISERPSWVGELWRAARLATNEWPGAFAHSSLGRGVVRLVLPAADAPRTDSVLSGLALASARRIAERVPADCWAHPKLTGAADDPLSRRARAAFDPRGILNPGIMGAVA